MSEAVVDGKGREIERASEIVTWLHVLLEAGELGARGDEYVQSASARLAALVHEFYARGERATVTEVDGVLWVGGARCRVEMRGFAAYAGIVSWMRARRFGELELIPATDESGTEQRFVNLAQGLGCQGATDASWLADCGLMCSRLPVEAGIPGGAGGDERGSTSRLGAVYLSRPLVDAIVEMGAVDLRLAKGVVQGTVDRLHAERALLPSLTRLQSGGRPFLRHAAAVCLFSVLVGRRLGFDEDLLSALGAGGLVHDIGRLETEQPDPAGADRGHAAAGYIALFRGGCHKDIELRAAGHRPASPRIMVRSVAGRPRRPCFAPGDRRARRPFRSR